MSKSSVREGVDPFTAALQSTFTRKKSLFKYTVKIIKYKEKTHAD